MRRPSERTLKAIANLKFQQEFSTFMDWLHASRADLIDALPAKTGEETVKMQGQLRDMNEIINTVDKATDYIRSLNGGNT